MIPAIILLLMRRYKKHYPQQCAALKAKLLQPGKIILLITIAICLVMICKAQEQRFSYTIKKGGSKIGEMCVKKISDGSKISLKLVSNVKASFLLSFTSNIIEEAIYDSGILIYSSIYQKLNGSEKINKQTTYVNNLYVINSKEGQEKLENIKIYYNLVCLYGHEPSNIQFLYSDKHQKFLPVQQLEQHHYKIAFPGGASNEYWYQDGICTKVKVEHTFYTAVMELIK